MENEILMKILETVEQFGLELKSLNDKVSSLDGKVSSLDSKVSSLDSKVSSLDSKVSSLDGKVSSLDSKVDLQFANIQASLNRIEVTQQEDVVSILGLINTKLEDTAKKSDVDGLRGDIEFVVKENSIFTLELDRLKRNNYNE
jgi:predicted nuclease with TOPRIM domain